MLCWALRLFWECFSTKGGRAGEYRMIWVNKCKYPANVYDRCLAQLPEPTEAKWQVKYRV